MIGILLVTHETLGQSLLSCASHILQKELPQTASISVEKTDDPDAKIVEATRLLAQINSGEGVLVFSDMCGGTPSNVAEKLRREGEVVAISGVSLPMLIRTLSYRHLSLDALMQKAMTGGREGVIVLGEETCCCCVV